MSIDILQIVIVLVVIFFSMTLHEVMHGLTAYILGDDTAKHLGRLSLNPLKHIDPFLTIILPIILAISGGPIFGGAKPVPFNPARVKYGEWGAALVAVAGPLTNLILAFVFFGIYVLIGTPISGLAAQFFMLAISVNLGFFIFNILPVPPLDGSRILYALAPEFVRRGMEMIEKFGIILIFILVMVASPVIGGLMQAGISFFIRLFSTIFGI